MTTGPTVSRDVLGVSWRFDDEPERPLGGRAAQSSGHPEHGRRLPAEVDADCPVRTAGRRLRFRHLHDRSCGERAWGLRPPRGPGRASTIHGRTAQLPEPTRWEILDRRPSAADLNILVPNALPVDK